MFLKIYGEMPHSSNCYVVRHEAPSIELIRSVTLFASNLCYSGLNYIVFLTLWTFMAHHKHHHNHHHSDELHGHSLSGEIMCHLPQAVFSVALALIVLSLVTYFSAGILPKIACKSAHMLFHSFHFMHIVFATTGTVVTFCRFSKNILKTVLIGIICPLIFCTLSDVIIPYIGGRLLGVSMHFHICFVSELANIMPFMLIGLINGFAISKHPEVTRGSYAAFSHGVHIFVSSLASSFYLVSHGFTHWYLQIGMVFLFLVIAVVVPCTLSDIVVPIAYARAGRKNEKYPL